jgi:hypothetical protein
MPDAMIKVDVSIPGSYDEFQTLTLPATTTLRELRIEIQNILIKGAQFDRLWIVFEASNDEVHFSSQHRENDTRQLASMRYNSNPESMVMVGAFTPSYSTGPLAGVKRLTEEDTYMQSKRARRA